MKKIIIFVLILILCVYYIYGEINSNVEIKQEKQDVIFNVIVNTIKKEVKTFEENIVFDENQENNISDIVETENEILVDSENNDFSDKNESIENTKTNFIDREELEIEMDSMLSDFVYEFGEKENLDVDDFENIFWLKF